MSSPAQPQAADTSLTAPALEPTPAPQRINSLDVIRGVAVLGILLMNIAAMGLPWQAYVDPTIAGGSTGLNLRVWIVTNLFFEGTMRALFSVLFGAGVLLFTGKEPEKDPGVWIADAWYRRMIWLFLFGLIHAYFLLWPGDILYSYGLMGMFLFPLRRLAPLRLFALGAALLAAGAVVSFLEHRHTLALHHDAIKAGQAHARGEMPSAEAGSALHQWEQLQQERKPSPEAIAANIAATQSGYVGAFKERAPVTTFFRSTFHYRYDYFDVLGMMLVGMALFKWGVLHAVLRTRVYAAMVLFGYAIGLAVNWHEVSLIRAQDFSVAAFEQASVTYDVGRIAMMIGHVGLIMLLCQCGVARSLTSSLAAVGRMALTNYILQTVITTTVFVGLGQFGLWERYELYYLVFGIWAVQLALSPLWLRHFRLGPLEWVWRALTYLRRPAFRVTQA